MSPYIDPSAKKSLDFVKKQQEERKLALIREQKIRELKDFETKLYYKQQEINRLKILADRLKRQSVQRQQKQIQEKREFLEVEGKVKNTEQKLQQLEQNIAKSATELSARLEQEKAALLEQQRKIAELEREKNTEQGKIETKKRSIKETIGRFKVFKSKEEKDVKQDTLELTHLEQELKQLEQQVEQAVASISSKLEQEKAVLLEQQRKIAVLEKQKNDILIKTENKKRTLLQGISRIKAFLSKDTLEKEKYAAQLQGTVREEQQFDRRVSQIFDELSTKLEQEKAALLEQQRKIAELEKQKSALRLKHDMDKRSLTEEASRAIFTKQKEARESQVAEQFFNRTQKEIKQLEISLQNFTQEAQVLQNKITALKSTIK